jgi:TatD DNase family protein
MLDSHCHLDRYPDPELIAAQAAQHGVFVLAVTNLPSHFGAGVSNVRALKRVRLALGLHPLAANDHARELPVFDRWFRETSFIGEVGLDFSRHGLSTAVRQLDTFRHVIRRVANDGKVVSLHSRGAELEVLDILNQHSAIRAIFHWYSGSLSTLDKILEAGHFLSVNPAMVSSAKGREILGRVPRERLLTETDGPHVTVGREKAMPWDVALVEGAIADLWTCSQSTVREQVWLNFTSIVRDQLPGGQAISDRLTSLS